MGVTEEDKLRRLEGVSLSDFGEKDEEKWCGSFLGPVEVQSDQQVLGIQLGTWLGRSEPIDWT